MSKKKVYWDSELGQIKTKQGRCLYDKLEDGGAANRFNAAMSAIDINYKSFKKEKEELNGSVLNCVTANYKATEDVNLLRQQLACAAKGHKMIFKEKIFITRGCTTWLLPILNTSIDNGWVFKCSNCGLEITKTTDELTLVEKDALKKLKLL